LGFCYKKEVKNNKILLFINKCLPLFASHLNIKAYECH
jgi:hypothetical protein